MEANVWAAVMAGCEVDVLVLRRAFLARDDDFAFIFVMVSAGDKRLFLTSNRFSISQLTGR